MFKKAVNGYYKLFDEKIKNGTLIVFIVASLIIIIGFLVQKNEIIKQNNKVEKIETEIKAP